METTGPKTGLLKARRKEYEVLFSLGLTRRQAEVYLSLIQSGNAKISTIAKDIGTERSEVIRGVSKLHELGLITKMLTDPPTYQAMPLVHGVNLLIEQKEEDQKNLILKAKKVAQRSRLLQTKTPEDSKYFGVFGNKSESRRLKDSLTSSQISLDGILDWRIHFFALNNYRELFKIACQRGVAFRFVCNIPPNQSLPKICLALKATGNYEIRRTSNIPPTLLAIWDRDRVSIVTFKSGIQAMVNIQSAIWSTNKDLVAMVEDYFNMKWEHASIIE